jgi:hypothetical protein
MRLFRILKWTWIAVHLLALQLTLNECMNEYGCFRSQDNLIAFTVLLGFPGSLLSILASVSLFQDALGPSQFGFLWFVGFIGGYVQWFVLLPRLLRASKPLTLGLSQLRTPPIAAEINVSPGTKETVQKKRRLRSSMIPQFDSKGRTPLQRALANHKN